MFFFFFFFDNSHDHKVSRPIQNSILIIQVLYNPQHFISQQSFINAVINPCFTFYHTKPLKETEVAPGNTRQIWKKLL